MKHFTTKLCAQLALVLMSSTCGADEPTDAELQEGRAFVSHLSLEQAGDQALLERAGFERAAQLLAVVMNSGLEARATSQEWTEMHRALGGLIELSVAQGAFLKAAVYAELQDVYYRNDEGDFASALVAARQALGLQRQSGQLATLYLPWKEIGEDLSRLGRLDEALDALYQARDLSAGSPNSIAAVISLKLVDGEIARGHFAAARAARDGFIAQADAASPPVFRARAALASAHLAEAAGRYDEALESILAGRRLMSDDPGRLEFEYECVNELMSVVLLAINALPYPTAMALAGRIDREFPGLPVSMPMMARQAKISRRRLAGDFDTLLRDDAALLERGNKA
jgi:tetratricopeptide (TPR) repeat protein